jgi:hypothetical protein
MSFVPAPQQAQNAASANNQNAVTTAASATAAAAATPDEDLLFKIRTFDVYWVEKKSLMYRAGIDKVRSYLSDVKLKNPAFART